METRDKKPSLYKLIADAEARRGIRGTTDASSDDDGPDAGPNLGGNPDPERDDGR